jgi:hypothetical protein
MIDPSSECVLFLLHCMGPVLAQSGTSPILFIFGGEADISCSRTAHAARVVLKNHTRS